ncbi:hypothetical protein LINGRAHAP2_LOCUS12306, partial [Linum grandiflorum]
VVDCATVSPLGFSESSPLLYCVNFRPAKSQGPPADLSQLSGMAARWGGFRHNSKQEPYILFPEIELPDRKAVKEEKSLIAVNSRLQGFWQSSSYYLEDTEDSAAKKGWNMEVERFADRSKKKTTVKRGPLDEFLQLRPAYFPRELVGGKKNVRSSKRARWSHALDVFEKLEQKLDGKETKEGEEEEEDKDEEVEEIEEDEFSDDDYNQNRDFDDDEDDFNDDAGGDDEGPLY